MKISGSPSAWAPFEDLVPHPTFYQYEIVTRADGLAATAIARGDLDGNGIWSQFEQTITIYAMGAARRPPIKIAAPTD